MTSSGVVMVVGGESLLVLEGRSWVSATTPATGGGLLSACPSASVGVINCPAVWHTNSGAIGLGNENNILLFLRIDPDGESCRSII